MQLYHFNTVYLKKPPGKERGLRQLEVDSSSFQCEASQASLLHC